MIDLTVLRENPELVKRSQEARGESADTVADFEEESADAVSVDFERLCNPFSIG